jgi:hypothetical protein
MVRRTAPSAFTIIELLVLFGVVMVLIGLLLPTLAGSRAAARTARGLASLQQNVGLIAMYGNDFAEVFPIADARLNSATLKWGNAMVRAGLVESDRDLDPLGFRATGGMTFALSHCMMHPPQKMRPGQTMPIEFAMSSPIRQSQVSSPSGKGLMYRWRVQTPMGDRFWCCSFHDVKGEVAFVDGSAIVAFWHEFRTHEQGLIENWVGYPVASTWDGVFGYDRR